MGDDFKMGVGRVMEEKPRDDATEERRKRSISTNSFSDDVIKTTKIGRGKRQLETPQSGTPESNPDSVFERIKATFNRIIDAAKELAKKMREMAIQGRRNNIPQKSNDESPQ